MTDPYVGEVRLVGFTYAPPGWVPCDGRTISINDNEALFQLLGTTYGGDGVNTFNVPDLRSRVPVGLGSSPATEGANLPIGQTGGAERVRLGANQIPPHTHATRTATARSTRQPAGAVRAPGGVYGDDASGQGAATVPAGGSGDHDNLPPSLAVGYLIATEGLYPPRP